MNVRCRLGTLGAIVAVALALCMATPATGALQPAGQGREPQVVSGEGSRGYLVRYRSGRNIAAEARSLRADGVDVRRTFGHAVKAVLVITTPAGAEVLAGSPEVLAVEPDRMVSISDTQQNPPWGLDRIDQRALPLSGTFTTPAALAGVQAYVVDTGVLANHVDLAGRVAPGFTVYNDQVGTSDCNGHGTHVAGTLAGTTFGVAKTATVIPVRAVACNGSARISEVIAGLDWVVAAHAAGAPAVLNMSLGGLGDDMLDAAVRGVVADGITVAVAAGNSAADACTESPARVAEALTVAASDIVDRQASFSNDGGCVDLYAPGVDIVSASNASSTAVASLSGTSMASPHVAGTAAVLLSQQPTLTPAQVGERVVADATGGVVRLVTGTTPNRLLFLAQPPPPPPLPPPPLPGPVVTASPPPVAAARVPARPDAPGATRARRAVKLVWTLGADGGSPLTAQTVRVYRGGDRVRTISLAATVTKKKVKGLRPGRAYRFTIMSTNVVGNSPESPRTAKVRPRS
ncbi:MAG TPA: S8 family serine peptidase [Nocardioides sp.]|uniref:S8 family serine peptidase n=1 Tax=Nocardioides sp. TaxID=35761 RepID=UPI002D7EF926|nr:S8 family serine peptidase [Nocardioides sp.]HET6652226.1 S8 family serine peptidase [Nocardioides sp.]